MRIRNRQLCESREASQSLPGLIAGIAAVRAGIEASATLGSATVEDSVLALCVEEISIEQKSQGRTPVTSSGQCIEATSQTAVQQTTKSNFKWRMGLREGSGGC